MPNSISLKAGAYFTYAHCITAKAIRAFAKLSGDRGSHHVEPDEQGRLMAHGLLTATLPTKLGGDLDFIGQLMIFKFVRPVYAGDTLTCSGVVDCVEPTPKFIRAKFSFSIVNQRGKLVLKGSSSGVILKNKKLPV